MNPIWIRLFGFWFPLQEAFHPELKGEIVCFTIFLSHAKPAAQKAAGQTVDKPRSCHPERSEGSP